MLIKVRAPLFWHGVPLKTEKEVFFPRAVCEAKTKKNNFGGGGKDGETRTEDER